MTATGRIAVFEEAGRPLEIHERPLPKLHAGELLVKVSLCTLCASDLHTVSGRRRQPTPSVLGHEVVGTVEALSETTVRDSAGRRISIGDRVTWSIIAHCGDCDRCRKGIPQKCTRLFKYGHEPISEAKSFSGGLADFCHLRPGTTVLRVPSEIPDQVACTANCASATVIAAFRVAGDCHDQVVLIHGAGMLGLTAAVMATLNNAGAVIVTDLDSHRLNLAKSFGAHRTVQVGEAGEELQSVVHEATTGRGVDVVFDFSGVPQAIESSLPLLGIGGRLILAGSVFPQDDFRFNAEQIVRRLIRIEGIHNYTPDDLADAITFLERAHDRFPLVDLVEHEFPLSEVNAAFAFAIQNRPIRVAVRPD